MSHYKLLAPGILICLLPTLAMALSSCRSESATPVQMLHAKSSRDSFASVDAVAALGSRGTAAQPPTGDTGSLDAHSGNEPMPAASEELVKRLNRERSEDFVSFVFAAKFHDVEEEKRKLLSKMLVNAAYDHLGDHDTVYQYLIGTVPLLTIQSKPAPARKAKAKVSDKNAKFYTMSLFAATLAPDLNKLCRQGFTKVNLKETAMQLRASFCYFDALRQVTGNYRAASVLIDHGNHLAELLRYKQQVQRQKQPVLAPFSAELDVAEKTSPILPSLIPSDDLVAVENAFRIDADPHFASIFNASRSRIAALNPMVSPMRQAVLASTLAQTTLSIFKTDEDSMAFVYLIGTISHFKASLHGSGLGGLTLALGSFAAQQCALDYTISEADLHGDQSNLLLSACLYRSSLQRFGGDSGMASAAYVALSGHGQAIAALNEHPVATNYSLSSWTEVTRPMPIIQPEGRTTDVVKAIAKIVRSPLQDSLRGRVTFPLLARIAEATYPDSEKSQMDWLIVLAMESKFDGDLTSETGARGIGQLIPTYAHDFGVGCNLTQVDADDLRDDATNALLSACYLKTLVEAHEGMVTLALAAYNAGLHSSDLVHYKRLSRMSNEPANYVARYSLIKESLDRVLSEELPAVRLASNKYASNRPFTHRIALVSAAGMTKHEEATPKLAVLVTYAPSEIP